MNNFSYWEQDAFLAPVDIIIAGAGLAGLWSAYHLKTANPSLKITLTDKSIIPRGASTRNAGFACFGSLTELLADIETMGLENMRQMVKMRFQGLERLAQTLAESEIDYKQVGGYELIASHQFRNSAELEEKIGKINRLLSETILRENVFSLVDHKIRELGFGETAHLVENRFEGQLHPGKLVEALLSRLTSLGVKVLSGVEITGFENTGDQVLLTTSLNHDLIAGQLLICANTFASSLSADLKTTPARGQVLLTSPIPDLKVRGTFHFDGGYYYFRDLGDRILLGGARNKAFEAEETNETGVSEAIQAELERFLQTVILPGKKIVIEQRWSGIMGVSENRFPLVRQLNSRVFCAVGMGGIGIAIAPVVGEEVSTMMMR